MGLLDHRRTWEYEVAASPEQCVAAFMRAFTGSGGLIAKANWDVARTSSGAVATYGGRKGLGALAGVMSRTSAHEQDTAVGSKVTFEAAPSPSGGAHCSMWLSFSGRAGVAGILGATADGRFIRPYMQAVADELRTIDPTLRVTTA